MDRMDKQERLERTASMAYNKGLINNPGENNCFLNSAVQVSSTFCVQQNARWLISIYKESLLFSASNITRCFFSFSVMSLSDYAFAE